MKVVLQGQRKDKITGKKGQVVGFDDNGNPIAQEAPVTGITEEQADARYLQLSGGTLTGPINVAEPTETSNPATKKYVDTALSGFTSVPYIAQGTAPDNHSVLWIDTSNHNIVKYYQNDEWKTIGSVWG